uniref:Uncharacterized protein n=1 Tax=Rhizophora mucronata TaxID=61149 RepID=A0A2P2M5W4_RHIMU
MIHVPHYKSDEREIRPQHSIQFWRRDPCVPNPNTLISSLL